MDHLSKYDYTKTHFYAIHPAVYLYMNINSRAQIVDLFKKKLSYSIRLFI